MESGQVHNTNLQRCSRIYVFNHQPLPPNELEVYMNIGTDSMVLDGDYRSLGIFHHVWDVRGPTSCDTTKQQIHGTSCQVKFECYGAQDWTITNRMAGTLSDAFASRINTLETYTQRECQEFSDRLPRTELTGRLSSIKEPTL